MKLFNKKELILNSSASALGLFTKAIRALQKVSDASKKLVEENEVKIKSLQTDNELLTKTADQHTKIIDNINKLLGVE